jgi:FixJ family two-component response regulator
MKGKAVVHIVDDNEDWRDSLSSLLESIGIVAKTYASAQVFLDTYDPDDYGCLILDLRMPGMSGLELQRELIKRNRRLQIIFITGHANVPTAVRTLREGALDFFEKPVDEQALLDRVQEVLRDIKVRQNQELEAALFEQLLARLTPRETEVLGLLVDGLSTRDIANQIGVRIRTIESYRTGILAKTGYSSMNNLLVHIKVRQSTR